MVSWHDSRQSVNKDIFLQRVAGSGNLLDEVETAEDETSPSVSLPVATSSNDYYENPAVVYNPTDQLYLLTWSNQEDGGIYRQRYSSSLPDPPGASFTRIKRATR